MNNVLEQIKALVLKAIDAKSMEEKMIMIGRESLATSYRESWQASVDEINSLALLLKKG